MKSNKANAFLFKIRNFVNDNTLKIIYYAIFDKHIYYANVVMAQNLNVVNSVYTSKMTLRIVSFLP